MLEPGVSYRVVDEGHEDDVSGNGEPELTAYEQWLAKEKKRSLHARDSYRDALKQLVREYGPRQVAEFAQIEANLMAQKAEQRRVPPRGRAEDAAHIARPLRPQVARSWVRSTIGTQTDGQTSASSSRTSLRRSSSFASSA